MKNYIYLLAATWLSFSIAYSEEDPVATHQIESRQHRLSVGPDVFTIRADGTFHATLGGLRMGYDYLKPQAFYFGSEALIAMGKSSIKYRSWDWRWRNRRITRAPLFANIEQRYGYTFQSPISAKTTLTPFTGIGWYYTRPQFHNHNIWTSWFYAATGLRMTQEFSKNFEIGFNLKAMYAFAGKRRSENKAITNCRDFWGYEVALPLTWHAGSSKKWDLEFQPYLLKIDTSCITYILGARLQAGYNF